MADLLDDEEKALKARLVAKATTDVITRYLTPQEAIHLANLNQPIEIQDHDLSRALAPIVSQEAADWMAAEDEIGRSAGDEPDSVVDVTSQYTKLGSVLIPRAFIASKPHWAVFPGGKLSHFQRKVALRVRSSKATDPPDDGAEGDSPLQEITNASPQVIKTRKTGRQKNIQWQNEKRKKANTDANYNKAFKYATAAFQAKKEGGSEKRSHQQIVDFANKKFNLEGGGGKEGSREQKKISISTIRRHVKDGNFGVSPKKKGRSPEVSSNWKALIACHINITQASTDGEADVATIKATMRASVMGTGKTFNLKNAWEDIRRQFADVLQPSGHIAAEDHRWQWCTLSNIKLQQNNMAEIFIKYGFAVGERTVLEDGTVIELTFIVDMLVRMNSFDESHHPIDNEHDSGGSRAITYTDPSLGRSGSRSTRSHHHVTGCYSVNLSPCLNPPMYIYSSKAKNPQIKDSWVETLGKTRGKWGHANYINLPAFVAARKEGSMDAPLFCQYIPMATYQMYPKETVSRDIQRDHHGRLVRGPVMWIVDFGQGRCEKNTIDTPEWDVWAQEMWEAGILIVPLLPNSTAVTALMDRLFGPFKTACREQSQRIFAERVQEHGAAVTKVKADMAAGVEVSQDDKNLLRQAVRMQPEDVGKIVFGELDEDRLPHPDSPIAKFFTPDKIAHAAREMGYYPWNPEKLHSHPKIRHEVGQEDETPQVRRMRELQAEYDRLKELCDEEGFNVTMFNSTLPTTSGPAERGSTVQEQAEALAKTGRTASAGAIWLSTYGDCLNSETVLLARRIQRQKWQEERAKKQEDERNKNEELEEAATLAWQKFKSLGEKKLQNPDLKAIVKFICAVEGRDDRKCPSKYSTRQAMLDRLSSCDKPWPSYFQSEESDEEEEDDAGEDSGEDGGNDGEAEGSSASGSDDSGSEQDDDGSDYEE